MYWGNLRLSGIAMLVVTGFLLAGCIRPVEVEPTPDPNQPLVVNTQRPVPTMDPSVTDFNSQLLIAVNQYFITYIGQTLPVTQGTFAFWGSIEVAPDIVAAFTFTNPSGLPCVGVAAYRSDQPMLVFTAGYHCGTDITASGVAGQWLLGLNSRPVVAIVGRVTAPNVQAVGIEFETLPATSEPLQNGNFLVLRPDLNPAVLITIPDSQGNLIGQLAVPLNPAG